MICRITNLLIAILSVFVLTQAQYARAAAGDNISSIATIRYSFLATTYVHESSPTGNTNSGVGFGTQTVFNEDRLINFSVVSTDASAITVATGQSNAVLTFSVTNSGNAPQDFLLSAVNTDTNPFGSPAENIDPITLATYVEDGATPGYQPGEDTAVFLDELAPTTTATVYVVASIPAANQDDVAAVSLVVQVAEGGAAGEGAAITADHNGNTSPAGDYSNGGTSVVAGVPVVAADTAALDIVFNDPAAIDPEDVDSNGVTDQVKNGQHADSGAYLVQSISALVISKTVTVIDTLGGNDPHAGATLRYRLELTSSGSGDIEDLVITDPIPANTTYTSSSISVNGVAQTDADFATDATDHSSFDGTNIIVDLSESGSKSFTAADSPTIITFDVTIN